MAYSLLSLLATSVVCAQVLHPEDYQIGQHDYLEYYVSTNGNDSNNGRLPSSPLRSLSAAYQKIPKGSPLTQPIRINIKPGNYNEDRLPNFWEDIIGTNNSPLIIRATAGPATAILKGDINAINLNYVYFIDLDLIPDPAGDVFHCELCDHILLKRLKMNGGGTSGGAHETLKINQSKNIFVEDCDISGADDNAIDYVAVQYGHIIRSRIHRAHDWCIYVKGGSAQLTIAGNTITDCGTGGFTAGQGTGFEFMQSPWLHYEAYDIRFINNLVYNTEGAGMGVNGGYNVTLAFNTLYKIGSRSHLIEIYRGRRGCDGDSATCDLHAQLGGWGGDVAEDQVIPNKNIYVYNNIAYNPNGFDGAEQHLAVHNPQGSVAGFQNISFPAIADQNLQIRGNLIWNGDLSTPVGIEDGDACTISNTTCNLNQLLAENSFNEIEPELINPETLDFRPKSESSIFDATTFTIPNFAGNDLPSTPEVPSGNVNNGILTDRGGVTRTNGVVGAYLSTLSPLGNIGPTGSIGDSSPVIASLNVRIKNSLNNTRKVRVRIRAMVTDPDNDIGIISARVESINGRLSKTTTLQNRNGVYKKTLTIRKRAAYNIFVTATDRGANSDSREIRITE